MSLISVIVVLAVALAFVLVQLVRNQGDDGSQSQEADAKSGSPGPGSDAESLGGLGWWPLRGSGTAKAGEHDAVLKGGANWAGPRGGVMHLNGEGAYADTGTRLDTADEDYSVAARVRLVPKERGMRGFFTAVSQDGDQASTFFLQYSGPDRNFAFSFPGARTVAEDAARPQPGRWYHLTGTYSQQDHTSRIYVDGKLAGSREISPGAEPTGPVVLGRAKFGGKPADFWKGGICDVHVYDRELTAREVSSLSSGAPKG